MRSRKRTAPPWIISALLMVVLCPHAHAGLTLNTANDPPNATEDHRGIGDRVLLEAFRRLGLKLTITCLPSERALINANEGVDDGNFARVEGIDAHYPNLIRVPEEITRFEFVAFTRGLKFTVDGWESVRPYNVGIITGWKILEQNITGSKSLTKAVDAKTLFNILRHGRTDIVVYDRTQGLVLLHKLKLSDVHAQEPPLAVKAMYPYLHKKYKELVPRLATVLREMKTDGSYQRIVNEVYREHGLEK